MRLCLVSDSLVGYHKNWSGAELIVQFLVSLLEKEGKDFSYIVINPGKKTPKEIFTVPALNGSIWTVKKIIPFHIAVRTIFAIFHLRKIKPDVVHLFHTNSLFIPVLLAAKILKIPTTFTVLDYFIICPTGHLTLKNADICREGEGRNCLKCVSFARLWQRKLVKWLVKDLKQIVTFTETSKRRLVEHGFPPEKIRVRYIYDFSSDIEAENNFSEEKPIDILFVGTFFRQKGLHVVIRAMSHVISEIPSAKLSLVGRGVGADKERIEKLVDSLELNSAVDFLGQKDNQEVLKLISRSRVVVVAEQWFSDFGPVALVESMALGRPVVAGRIGSAPDFIEEGVNGLLVEYDNPEDFAKKIIWLLKNQEAGEEMGQKARKSIQALFGPENNQEIIKLYART